MSRCRDATTARPSAIATPSSRAAGRRRSTATTCSAGSTRRQASRSVRRVTLNFYGGYSEGSRAATSIELGCANPDEPCKLPNAMAGDPPLDQVVTRTWEAGARGAYRGVSWSAGLFRSDNHDDILFVLSGQTGFGYFTNFGETRRQGLELGAHSQLGRVTIGAGYTLLSATYRERRDGQRRKQQHQRRCGRRRTGSRRFHRNRARRSNPAHSAPHVQGVRGHLTRIEVVRRRRSVGGVRIVCPRQREQFARAGRHVLPRLGFSARIRDREPGGRLPADAVDAACRAGHEPVRPQATTRRDSSGLLVSPTPAPSSRGPSPRSTESSRFGRRRSTRRARR